MKIEVEQVESKPEVIKVSFREAGRRGGLAKVPKGFAKMDEEKRKEIAKRAANRRWNNEKSTI